MRPPNIDAKAPEPNPKNKNAPVSKTRDKTRNESVDTNNLNASAASAAPSLQSSVSIPVDTGPIRITYFRGYGRADPIRFMLSHKGVPFEEIGVTPEGWGAKKASGDTGEMGGLPIVHGGGAPQGGMQQLSAIMRNYGLKYGYYPSRAAEWAKCGKIDEIIYTWADLLSPIGYILMAEDMTDAEYGDKIAEIEDILGKLLNICEKQLKA